MAIVDAVITDKARQAVQVIGQWGYVRVAYLFGSQVQGTADQWSDIDVAAFVEDAEEWDFDRVSRACGAVQQQAGLDIEMHIFPASAYEKPSRASFAEYILKHGVRIVEP